jgi:hypothetical protein
MTKFWMIVAADGPYSNNAPHVQHKSEKEARAEAERLCRLHIGSRYVILEAKDYVVVPPSAVSWCQLGSD